MKHPKMNASVRCIKTDKGLHLHHVDVKALIREVQSQVKGPTISQQQEDGVDHMAEQLIRAIDWMVNNAVQ